MLRSLAVLLATASLAAAAAAAIKPDAVVAKDGSGDYDTVQKAIDAVTKSKSPHERAVILIKDGVYPEKVRIDADCITLRGQSRKGSRIEYPQLNDDFSRQPDRIGRAIVNINADDVVLDTLTVKNTAGVVGPHAFAVYGTGDRTVTVDCDILSEGADTLSLWRGDRGRYYHARCNVRGAVDFTCPRGWCYAVDCNFYETKATAAVWHDGSKNKDMKFVLKHCTFDGVEGFNLARHHHDAQFFFLDCTFSRSMIDQPPYRVIYPLNSTQPTQADVAKNKDLDKTNIWGERAYYHNCHRTGGDYPWMKDNLDKAPGSPKPADVTAKWTFAGTWDPERTDTPHVTDIKKTDTGRTEVVFSEIVTVKGKPALTTANGTAAYVSGSGSDHLVFEGAADGDLKGFDLKDGRIIASEADAKDREAGAGR